MKLKYTWDMAELMAKVKKWVIDNGWSFMINENKGKIEIKWCEVWFTLQWEIINIEVLDKPFLVSTSYVEEKISETIKKYI